MQKWTWLFRKRSTQWINLVGYLFFFVSIKFSFHQSFFLLIIDIFSETYRHLASKGDPAEKRLNLEEFYALANELSWRTKSNGVSCESEIPSVWRIFCRKTTKSLLRRAFIHPFNRFLGIFYIVYPQRIIKETETNPQILAIILVVTV